VEAFFRKELSDIVHQPRLLVTLVLGPFLILLAFGLGYRERTEPFDAWFVAAPGSVVLERIQQHQDRFARYVRISGTGDEAAGIAALRHGEAHLARMRDVYDARRAVLVDGLRALGFRLPVAPQGAFYVLVDARDLGRTSLDLAFALLDAAHVAVGPGRDFGEIAEGHLRFSFATSEAKIREGLRRLGEALPRVGGALRWRNAANPKP
jgi:aspartate/methionine/tyrosine aminotransferase